MKHRQTPIRLDPAHFTALTDAITALEQVTRDYRGLTAKDRMRIRSVGQRTEAFAQRALDAGRQNPDLIPRGIDLEQLAEDLAARETLLPLVQRVQQINALIRDTLHLVGADVLQQSLTIYHALQRNGQEEGLAQTLNELQARFHRPKRKAPANQASAAEEMA